MQVKLAWTVVAVRDILLEAAKSLPDSVDLGSQESVVGERKAAENAWGGRPLEECCLDGVFPSPYLVVVHWIPLCELRLGLRWPPCATESPP